MKTNTVKWQLLMCALLIIICLLVISLVNMLLAGTTGMNISLPVSITLVFVGLMIIASVLIVYLVHKWIKRKSMDITMANTNDNVSRSSEPNKEVKDDSFMGEEDEYTIGDRGVRFSQNPAQGTGACGSLEWQVLVCALLVFFCLLTTNVVVLALVHYLGTDIALPVSISLILAGVMVFPVAFMVYCALKWARHNKQSLPTNPKKTNIHTYAYVCDHNEDSIETESGHSTIQGSEEDEIAARRVETTADLNRGYGIVTSKPTFPDMVDEYDCELPELNEGWTCDNLLQSTNPKMIDTHDNVLTAPGREVVYKYRTGVRSEDEIAARRVEIIPNPAYGTVTCKPTTPDMVDEYDCELPELNEERTCDHPNPQESTNPKITDTYDNVYDPAIIEPNREEVYDYSRSSGVGSGEDEIAARRVETTVNPSYGIATYKSTNPYMVNQTNMN